VPQALSLLVEQRQHIEIDLPQDWLREYHDAAVTARQLVNKLHIVFFYHIKCVLATN
jgi:hypothetical protein